MEKYRWWLWSGFTISIVGACILWVNDPQAIIVMLLLVAGSAWFLLGDSERDSYRP